MPILSFSVPAMLPSVAMGLIARGKIDFNNKSPDVFWKKISKYSELPPENTIYTHLDNEGRIVKTQTIRRYDFLNPNPRSWHHHIKPGDNCDIWWKQRAPKIGFKMGSVKLIAVYKVRIENMDGRAVVNVMGSKSGMPQIEGDSSAHQWIYSDESMDTFAQADGFLDRHEFRDYFVPDHGDVFLGNLLAW